VQIDKQVVYFEFYSGWSCPKIFQCFLLLAPMMLWISLSCFCLVILQFNFALSISLFRLLYCAPVLDVLTMKEHIVKSTVLFTWELIIENYLPKPPFFLPFSSVLSFSLSSELLVLFLTTRLILLDCTFYSSSSMYFIEIVVVFKVFLF